MRRVFFGWSTLRIQLLEIQALSKSESALRRPHKNSHEMPRDFILTIGAHVTFVIKSTRKKLAYIKNAKTFSGYGLHIRHSY